MSGLRAACGAALIGVGGICAPAAVSRAALPPAARTIEVWMAVHERAAQQFIDAVSTPGSPSYEQYLSPAAYTRTFGPTAEQVAAVTSSLRAAGFTSVRAGADADYVSATAPARTVEREFAMRPGAAGIVVPAAIRRDVLAVTGLDGATVTDDAGTPDGLKGPGFPPDCSAYFAQRTETLSPPVGNITQAAIPVCGYDAKQIRAAYEATTSATGRGQTVAIIQVGAPSAMFRSLTHFAKLNGLPAPRASQYQEVSVDGGASDAKCINGALEEAAIDSETLYTMAPGADQLMVDGNDCATTDARSAQSLLNAMLYPLTGPGAKPKATIESVSYGLSASSEAKTPLAEEKAAHAVALRADAEGVSLLVASGDYAGTDPPATDPDVTAVGGTTLGVGADDQRVLETGWSTSFVERVGTSAPWQAGGGMLGAGGGPSSVFAEPGYQKAVVPAAMALNGAGHAGRVVPDVSADADPYTGMRFGSFLPRRNGTALPYASFRQAGTSMATPLVAGLVADAEQGQPTSFGFLNPRLYSLYRTRAFHDILPVSSTDPDIDRAFFSAGETDIKGVFKYGYVVGLNDAQGTAASQQVTAPGYDTMTGLGTPDGIAFIRGLRSGR